MGPRGFLRNPWTGTASPRSLICGELAIFQKQSLKGLLTSGIREGCPESQLREGRDLVQSIFTPLVHGGVSVVRIEWGSG